MPQQNNIDDLKPGPETDDAVAKALVTLGTDVVCTQNDAVDFIFQPSTDLNDAFWAAEQARLPNGGALYRHGYSGVWVVGKFRLSDDELIDIVSANTPALAICKAILKLENESKK